MFDCFNVDLSLPAFVSDNHPLSALFLRHFILPFSLNKVVGYINLFFIGQSINLGSNGLSPLLVIHTIPPHPLITPQCYIHPQMISRLFQNTIKKTPKY